MNVQIGTKKKVKKGLFADASGPAKTQERQEIRTFDGTIASQTKVEGQEENPLPELIIKPPDTNWRDELAARRRQAAEIEKDESQKLKYGLSVVVKEPVKDEDIKAEETTIKEEAKDEAGAVKAIAAAGGEGDEDDEQLPIKVSEIEAYKQDLASCPDAPDLETYARVPVEQFGVAMLRGMGWTGKLEEDNEDQSEKPAERRPALLGLGARATPGMEDVRLDKAYMPLKRVEKDDGGSEVDDNRQSKNSRESNAAGEDRPGDRDNNRDRDQQRERNMYRDRESSSEYDKYRTGDRSRHYDRYKQKDRPTDYDRYRERDSPRSYDRYRERDSPRDYDRYGGRDRRRQYDSSRPRDRHKAYDRPRSRNED